jgi:CDP-paratose 2-epimerase
MGDFPMNLLVTGSSGLIGSEVATTLAGEFDEVHGIDGNQRAAFFGRRGDTRWRQAELERHVKNFRHVELDIRDREGVMGLFERVRPELIVHAAAQPSHDLSALIPFDDFETNAVGTLNLLEATRRYAERAVFVFLSTNKVYGDRPNTLPLTELETRWDYEGLAFHAGIPESFPIDQSCHSLFGASKLSADVLVQEYGRCFGIRTCCLRGGCLTGPNHAGVELHGFLSHLVRTNLEGRLYTVYGHKGKQVRDNIHSHDVARFVWSFFQAPRVAEVYNIGGGRENSISILEAFERVGALSGKPMRWTYREEPRVGDHVCYISDLSKLRAHYPEWRITRSLDDTLAEMVARWRAAE